MSRMIALATKRSLDLTPIVNELVNTLHCEVVDTLKNSYIIHQKMNSPVLIIDPKTGPHQSTFNIFRTLNNAKRCVDSIIKMVSVHNANTEVMGDIWTDTCIPVVMSKYVLVVGVYTTKDVERIQNLGGKIVFLSENSNVNYGSIASVMSNATEAALLSSDPHVVSYHDEDIINNIISVIS